MSAARRRASRRDIRDLLTAVEAGGWTVEEPKGKSNVFKAKCPCGRHLEWIHSTPSGPNYARRKLAYMKNTCWRED